jgi:TolB protein
MSIKQSFLRNLFASALFVCFAQGALAADPAIELNKLGAGGFPAPVPVSISGFSGEILTVLQDDLIFMGMTNTTPDQAKYLITGSNNGKVEGRVTERINKNQVLAKSYNGGTTRGQTHAFADDIAKAITPNVPPIAQTKVAFKVEIGGGNSEVYIADYDGVNARAVTSDRSIIAQPTWAGKGALYYTSYKLGSPFIFRHELATGARQSISHFAGLNSSAAVSPDGTRICMILSKNGSPDVYVAGADGSNPKQLTFTREDESSPCWSPDGKTICYVSRESGTARLYTISASGGKPTRIMTTGITNPTEPDYSPDGKWIAFTSQARDFTICIVKAEGGDAILLVSGEDPSWAPNSRALLFCKGPDHEKSLCLLDVPTKHVKTIHRILESNSYPSWAK